ncbi:MULTISPECIES: enolase C-terminal domain-like protein [unclassified Caballeronia]|uniref:enolase C-terminal domain-like protein n=1 Tax=unclassified Caballeronia TaxID=2646786 RepID=UPI00286038DD|nr:MULTISPECIES: enolase C-terminal domain-like protein [unclassified Caballeronia]MDR5815150.1 enolase C-terminal domain-like protein [Caballeronia sp. LZ033]MDR5879841.1 enolase C-terminal domain-like protein [Caballeronia sp. LZ032]
MQLSKREAPIETIRARAYTIPTDKPEADGTFTWDATTLIVVEIVAAGKTGLGYTYSDASVAKMIEATLAPVLQGEDAWHIDALWQRLQQRVRNIGRSGVAATAISALDCALWDVKARLLDMPLARLLGMVRTRVPLYGSGGFTTYSDDEMREQLTRWVHEDGCRWVKIKIGSEPARDPHRVAVAREAIGAQAGLFVDANGALTRKQALHCAQIFAEQAVEWFEEPLSSDDIAGLASLRGVLPARMELAAGEYGYTLDDFRVLLDNAAVDVLQADVTRCGGITGFLRAATLCDAFHLPLSAHCAPAMHLHVACAAPRLRHQEWFHDHVRIEQMLFDGAPRAVDGAITPDLSRPGCGLEFKYTDAHRYAV